MKTLPKITSKQTHFPGGHFLGFAFDFDLVIYFIPKWKNLCASSPSGKMILFSENDRLCMDSKSRPEINHPGWYPQIGTKKNSSASTSTERSRVSPLWFMYWKLRIGIA